MVLAELGQKLTGALSKFNRNATVGEEETKLLLNEVSMALLQADVNIKIVQKLQASIKSEMSAADSGQGLNRRKMAQQAVMNSLTKILDPGVKPFIPKKGTTSVVMFVGLQGSGKTTSCTKYALYFQKKGLKVGLVCADTFRAGAYDQLKQNAAKAKVRFYGSLTVSDPVAIAREGVRELRAEKYDLIIVDTSGRHKQEAALFDEMKQVQDAVVPNDIVFVMSATDGQGVHDQATQFKAKVPVGSVIVTKLDCHTKGGGALSAVAATQSPIVFIGTGEHMDEIELFKPDSFVSKMLGMGDLGSLVDTLKDAKIDENAEVYARMQEGQFSMRDLQEHLQNMMKLGNMGKLMEMIPGLGALAAGGGGENSSAAVKSFLFMMDSMTEKELDDPKPMKNLSPASIARIARGSGRSVQEVINLLKMYNQFEDVFKSVGKMNLKQMGQDPSAALSGRAGQQQLGQIAKALNPAALQQLGGVDGLQGMMKQLAGMDMSGLAGMMGGMGGGGGGGGGGRGGMPSPAQIAAMMGNMGGGAAGPAIGAAAAGGRGAGRGGRGGRR